MWGALIFVFALFYFILALLDMPFGGFIMRSLRCENLPGSWSNISNWHNGNAFTRTFLCSKSCRKSFYPSSELPICVKQKKDEPIYAPHQVIYNTYMNNDYLSNIIDKMTYSHTPNYEYFTKMTSQQQQKIWNKVYEDRKTYNEQCVSGSGGNSGYTDYDDLIQHMCVSFQRDPMPDESAQDQIMGMCQSVYCSTDSRASRATFCSQAEDTTSLINAAQEPKDLVRIIIFTVIIIAVLVVLLAFLLKSDDTDSSMFKEAAEGFTSWINKFKKS
jgi:hypothetical protein